MDANQLQDVLLGLEENGLLQYSHVLTGYIGNPELLKAIETALIKLRLVQPNMYIDYFSPKSLI